MSDIGNTNDTICGIIGMRQRWLCQQPSGTRRDPQGLRALGGCVLAGTANYLPAIASQPRANRQPRYPQGRVAGTPPGTASPARRRISDGPASLCGQHPLYIRALTVEAIRYRRMVRYKRNRLRL